MEPTTPLTDNRWFPSGKVVFVAPPKPLAQQIEACHQTCGIPGSDTIELTGEVSSKNRFEAVSLGTLILYMALMLPCPVGREAGVLYCTATLMNDLIRGGCDASKIVPLVIGEHLFFVGIRRPDPQRKHRREHIWRRVTTPTF